jgi:hypothetical protein
VDEHGGHTVGSKEEDGINNLLGDLTQSEEAKACAIVFSTSRIATGEKPSSVPQLITRPRTKEKQEHDELQLR